MKFNPHVFDDDADVEEKFQEVREFCLTMVSWISEDIGDRQKLKQDVKELHRQVCEPSVQSESGTTYGAESNSAPMKG